MLKPNQNGRSNGSYMEIQFNCAPIIIRLLLELNLVALSLRFLSADDWKPMSIGIVSKIDSNRKVNKKLFWRLIISPTMSSTKGKQIVISLEAINLSTISTGKHFYTFFNYQMAKSSLVESLAFVKLNTSMFRPPKKKWFIPVKMGIAANACVSTKNSRWNRNVYAEQRASVVA